MPDLRIDRRRFLSALGGTAVAASVSGFISPLYASDRRIAFVAVADGIHTMERNGSVWHSREFIDADAPTAMVLSADERTLYVANATGNYNGLPTGSVTSYYVSAAGKLQRAGSVQLALSAVRPYALMLSPKEDLLIAASEGGVVSALTVAANGQLGAVVAAHKSLTADPMTMKFDTDGLLRIACGAEERSFRISSDDGFTLMSCRPLKATDEAAFDAYGIANAKAAVCLSA